MGCGDPMDCESPTECGNSMRGDYMGRMCGDAVGCAISTPCHPLPRLPAPRPSVLGDGLFSSCSASFVSECFSWSEPSPSLLAAGREAGGPPVAKGQLSNLPTGACGGEVVELAGYATRSAEEPPMGRSRP